MKLKLIGIVILAIVNIVSNRFVWELMTLASLITLAFWPKSKKKYLKMRK